MTFMAADKQDSQLDRRVADDANYLWKHTFHLPVRCLGDCRGPQAYSLRRTSAMA